MPLEAKCLEWLRHLVWIDPAWGYGWQRFNDANSLSTFDWPEHLPNPFPARIQEFVYDGESIVGAFAVIEEQDSEFNGFWTAFFARPDDFLLNFTTEIGPYNLMIAPEKPHMGGTPKLRPKRLGGGCDAAGIPRLFGHAYVGVSLGHIRDRWPSFRENDPKKHGQ
jgi:hypothetical protein